MQDDLLYNILLKSDIDSILQLKLVFKQVENIADKLFWINKFANDGLPIQHIRDNFKDWIKEYKYTFASKKKAVDFVNLLFIEYDYRLIEHKNMVI